MDPKRPSLPTYCTMDNAGPEGAIFGIALAIIGASLSEPHTSVTALRTRVCMRVWTNHLPSILNECIQIFHDD